MPTYEYACRSCGEHLEVVQSFKDDPLTECPSCHGDLRKVFGNIGISFKGSGFYKTDSRSSSSGPRSKTSEASGGDSSASGSSSGEPASTKPSGGSSEAGAGSGSGQSPSGSSTGSASSSAPTKTPAAATPAAKAS